MTATIMATQLRCEYLTNPPGIDVAHPRLTWRVESPGRAQSQSAYQILVASSEEKLAANEGDLWDSGKVVSAQSIHVAYAGQTLTSGLRCWWKVRVWDTQDNSSAYSAPAWWEMGLLQSSDWQAQWISLDEQATTGEDESVNLEMRALEACPYLRKDIKLKQPIQRARLYVTARGLYEISINGQRVGEAVLAPGWTDYHKRIQYQTYDVTSLVRQGENALGAILGPGWYSGHVGFPHSGKKNYYHYGSRMQLLLQLHITYTDQSSEVIVSDGTWKGTNSGPILYSDMLAGESYDARKELIGWNQVGFDDTDWYAVATQALDAVPLVADRAQPILVTEKLQPHGISEVLPGVFIFDMGQNMVGWVRLRVAGEAGTKVQLRFAEVLNPDGTLYTANLRSARQIDTYILKGGGEEFFEPRFTFHGFRYVEITGYPGTPPLDALTGCVIHSATPPVGSFECSHPMVNQLQRNIVWGQRGNFISVPTDCPQRDERLGWMGDAQIFVNTACYNMDVAAFFTKWLNDVQDAQSEEGDFSDVSPRLIVTTNGAPAWGDAGVIVPWTLYRMYGDTRIIEEHYDAMTRWIAYLERANPDYLRVNNLGDNYGDWLSINADTPKEVLATAYYAYDAKLLAEMASAIGRHKDTEKYHALFQSIRSAFCDAFVRSDGSIKNATQTCYVLALHMDLLPADLHPLAAKHLVADIEQRGWHLSTGFVGVGYLCLVLSEAGYTNVAYRLLLNDTFPSWGYSIKHGATTIWERWDGWTEEQGFQSPSMNSFNHYAFGSVGQWLYQYVAGITMDLSQPGKQRCIIRPYPHDELTFVDAEYDSICGPIRSRWRSDNGSFTLSISLPANVSATVYIPASNKEQVYEGSVPAPGAEGVTFLREENGQAIFAVQSGNYEFSVSS
jgi:alpha-L-rhamnosidase